MKEAVNLIKNALVENRNLSDIEIKLLIKVLLNHYNVFEYVKDFELDYSDKYNEIAGYDSLNKTMYFNMNIINCIIFKQYCSDKKIFSFNEYYVLEQLSTILHEIRHVIQLNSDFSDKEVLKQIVNDADVTKYPSEVYSLNHSLFPLEKDAKVFSLDQTIEIVKQCNYFKKDVIRKMYTMYFFELIKGYDLKISSEGTLKEFYEKIVLNLDKYLEHLKSIDKLSTHDKMSFNMPLSEDDLHNLRPVPELIARDFNPGLVLKKVRRK